MPDRVILHSDLNNFYASVECLHKPELRGKPVAVCGDAELRHGIVLAKNYVAKAYGIRTGDVIWEAKQKCPNLEVVTADFPLYLRFSSLTRRIYDDYSDRVESYGIDECWLDVTGADGRKIADGIRSRIKAELGLTASVGVSWNKIFAKLASDLVKPDATVVISRENYREKVCPLPASDLLYVGRATEKKLRTYGITTIGGIADAGIDFLRLRLGKWGEYLWCFASGLDTSPVASTGAETLIKSIGNSSTAPRDLVCREDLVLLLTVLSESVAARLKEQGLKGNVVSLYLRDSALNGYSKQAKIARPTDLSDEVIAAALKLSQGYSFCLPVRCVGVKVSGLSAAGLPLQTDLFTDEKARLKKEKLEAAVDEVRRRFGHFAINRAVEYLDKELTHFNPKAENVIHPYSFFNGKGGSLHP